MLVIRTTKVLLNAKCKVPTTSTGQGDDIVEERLDFVGQKDQDSERTPTDLI